MLGTDSAHNIVPIFSCMILYKNFKGKFCRGHKYIFSYLIASDTLQMKTLFFLMVKFKNITSLVFRHDNQMFTLQTVNF
jgi:hypothetical protein